MSFWSFADVIKNQCVVYRVHTKQLTKLMTPPIVIIYQEKLLVQV